MQGIVHFAVGASGGLLLLALVRPPSGWYLPAEAVAVWLSGVWATIPDWWWFLTARFYPSVRAPALGYFLRDTVHASPLVNVFWFHHALDQAETGHPRFEARVALLGLTVAAVVYAISRVWWLVAEPAARS